MICVANHMKLPVILMFDLMYCTRSHVFMSIDASIMDSLCVSAFVLLLSLCAADVVPGEEKLPALFVCSSTCLFVSLCSSSPCGHLSLLCAAVIGLPFVDITGWEREGTQLNLCV